MAGKQAKILSEDDFEDLLVYAAATRNPLRDRVIVLLSAKAGLRAAEIAQLTWDMVLGPTGVVSAVIELRDHAAKKFLGRTRPWILQRGSKSISAADGTPLTRATTLLGSGVFSSRTVAMPPMCL